MTVWWFVTSGLKSGLARGRESPLTTALPLKIPLRNWVVDVAWLCLRSDLAVVATNRQRHICSWISLTRLSKDHHHLCLNGGQFTLSTHLIIPNFLELSVLFTVNLNSTSLRVNSPWIKRPKHSRPVCVSNRWTVNVPSGWLEAYSLQVTCGWYRLMLKLTLCLPVKTGVQLFVHKINNVFISAHFVWRQSLRRGYSSSNQVFLA